MSFVFIPDEMFLEKREVEDCFVFVPRGVCTSQIRIKLNGDILEYVEFTGGCRAGLGVIAEMIEGMSIYDIAKRWEGRKCGSRETSCIDQLVRGCFEALDAQS